VCNEKVAIYKRGVSLEGRSVGKLVVFYNLCASVIWPYKRGTTVFVNIVLIRHK
jgi:hypothetical protein